MVRRTAAVGVTIVAAVALAGCSGQSGPMRNPAGPSGMGSLPVYSSNGERIYFTATSASGSPISYTGGAFFGGMGRMGCAACHGPSGHGGSSTMMGYFVNAPNITWPALTTPDPNEDHQPYTEDSVKAAITRGVDPAGHDLDPAMPRWSMSAADLDDLVAYLKTLR